MKGIDETNRMTLFSILSVMKIRKFSAKNRENYVKKILIPTENTLKHLTRKFKVQLVACQFKAQNVWNRMVPVILLSVIQIRKIKVFLGNHYSKWKFAIFVFKRRQRFQFSSEIYLVGTQKKGNDETNRKILFSTLSVMKIRKFSAQNRENLMKKYLCQKKTRFKI